MKTRKSYQIWCFSSLLNMPTIYLIKVSFHLAKHEASAEIWNQRILKHYIVAQKRVWGEGDLFNLVLSEVREVEQRSLLISDGNLSTVSFQPYRNLRECLFESVTKKKQLQKRIEEMRKSGIFCSFN